MDIQEEGVGRRAFDQQLNRVQGNAPLIDFVGLVGSSAGDMAGALSLLTHMRPQTALNDLLPELELENGAIVSRRNPVCRIGRDRGGEFVATTRRDGSVSQRYETGAHSELDRQQRLISMALPGPRGITVRMEYQGDSRTPSALTVVNGAKEGDLRIAAGPGIRFDIDHSTGYVGVTDAQRGTGASFAINGERTDVFETGSARHSYYAHSDQSNTAVWTHRNGGPGYTVVDRADGSGYTECAGTRIETRFAPGTNFGYRIIGGRRLNEGEQETVNFADVREIEYRPTDGLGMDARITTGDGRQYHLSAIGSGLRGEPTVVAVRQVSPGKVK